MRDRYLVSSLVHIFYRKLRVRISRTGGLTITLAGPNRRVLGGCVTGLLTAATPLQVMVGSFVSDGAKELKFAKYMGSCSAPPKGNLGGIIRSSTSPAHGTPSESSDGPASPLNLNSGGAYKNTTSEACHGNNNQLMDLNRTGLHSVI